jgi:hypothetical protein
LSGLQNLGFATAIRESDWLFPIIETVHVLALSMVVGSIFMLDLRLLGVASLDRRVTAVSASVLPWTWAGFCIAALAGLLMFASAAVKYWGIDWFRAKLILLALAGVNMLVFQFITSRRIRMWDLRLPPPCAARVAGAISIILWISIVVCGRWIGFTSVVTPPA